MLEKCRYCGNHHIHFHEYHGSTTTYWMVCADCKNHTEEYCTQDEAYRAWNRENHVKTIKIQKK